MDHQPLEAPHFEYDGLGDDDDMEGGTDVEYQRRGTIMIDFSRRTIDSA